MCPYWTPNWAIVQSDQGSLITIIITIITKVVTSTMQKLILVGISVATPALPRLAIISIVFMMAMIINIMIFKVLKSQTIKCRTRPEINMTAEEAAR